MTPALITELLREALVLALLLSLPILAATFAAGLISGFLQAVTGVQDASLGLIPRIVVGVLVLAMVAPWASGELLGFADTLVGALVDVQRT